MEILAGQIWSFDETIYKRFNGVCAGDGDCDSLGDLLYRGVGVGELLRVFGKEMQVEKITKEDLTWCFGVAAFFFFLGFAACWVIKGGSF